MTLPPGFTLDTAHAAGQAIPWPEGGYAIVEASFDREQTWRKTGAKNIKHAERGWVAVVPDLTTLVRCAQARGPVAVSPEVARHLQLREEALEASRAPTADVQIPAPPGLAYLPFQRAGIAYAQKRKGVLIGDEMGLGKTIQALGLINASRGTMRSALVVCPASLRLNWQREAERWLMGEWYTWVALDGSACPAWANLAIVNYDRLGKHPELYGRDWDLIVMDEAHLLKNMKTRRTRYVLGGPAIPHRPAEVDANTGAVVVPERPERPAQPALVDRAKRKVFLTGTPLLNRTSELYPICKTLAPASFPSESAFIKRYCGGMKAGASNLDELQEKMRAAFMVRRLKKDVLTELPPKRRQVIELQADDVGDVVDHELAEWDKQESKLDELRAEVELARARGDGEGYKEAVRKLREGARVAFTEIAKVRHDTAVAKIPYVVEHVRELFAGGVGKLLLFAHHLDCLHAYRDQLSEFGVVYIDGATSVQARQAAVDRFQTDDGVRLAVLSIQAAGVGLTLTASSTVAFAELDWVPAWVSQAEDRAHRYGQKASVNVLHLVFNRSLDARMAKTIINKQEIADQALDRKADPAKVAEAMSQMATPDRAERGSKRPKVWPKTEERERVMLLAGLQSLVAACDGAQQRDGAGFSKLDGHIGRSLAQGISTDGQAYLAAKLCRKYRRQIDAAPVDVAEAVLKRGEEQSAAVTGGGAEHGAHSGSR
jgi:SWI/SNF-related matrix-associated actin-dependent regulator 1 of chromatin subfamily A